MCPKTTNPINTEIEFFLIQISGAFQGEIYGIRLPIFWRYQIRSYLHNTIRRYFFPWYI